MCGINGVFSLSPQGVVDETLVVAMRDAQIHRGPDGAGVRMGPGYGLGHRRLSIVDLDNGVQPMTDASGAVWITYNGEIYNYLELRAELRAAGHRFQTECDTEVLVYGYLEWGRELPKKLVGMFSFAIVDERNHSLFAARDRMGQKPFHYTRVDDQFLFGSEIKSILVDERVSRAMDRDALGQYLVLSYVPDPKTIFDAIHKLPPASTLTIRDGQVRIEEYWSPDLLVEGADNGITDLAEQQAELLGHLDSAVEGRLMGDVPLGAFLSGGVDSFAVVDSMSRVSSGDVLACTVGFDHPAYDEREYARAAAKACQAQLHEEVLRVEDMLDIGWFSEVYDEPFADSSAIPTYHVSRMARQHVTVALSGDGGDESFAGYRRYRFDAKENTYRSMLPRGVWAALGSAYPKLDFLPRWMRLKRTFQNLASSPEEAYARSVSAALPAEVMPLLRPEWRSDDPLKPVRDAYREAEGCHPLVRCAHADRRTYLPGDILTKVDRASMAVSLEVRSPFLDHRLVEFAAGLTHQRQLLKGESKGFLRESLAARLGREALDRPKRGFSVPLADWMRGSLGDSLELALADGPLETYLDIPAAQAVLRQHRSGIRDHSRTLWALLVFHLFLRRWVG